MNAFDIIQFFYNKEEHYPISDIFMERYQQSGGGYLDFARKTGHCVCKNLHEPNQKWHLFESWLLQTAAGNKEKPLEKIRVNGFKCPELLLWMAEAAGVETERICEAAKYAGEKIDLIRRENPKCSYSAESVRYLNQKMKQNHEQTFWEMIVEKVTCDKK